MITVNEKYEFERNSTCWILHIHEPWTGRSPATGEIITTVTDQTLYFSKLSSVINAMLDIEAGTAQSLAEIKTVLNRLRNDIFRTIRNGVPAKTTTETAEDPFA